MPKIKFSKSVALGLALGAVLGASVGFVSGQQIGQTSSSQLASHKTDTNVASYSFASPVFGQMTDQLDGVLKSYSNYSGVRLDDKVGVIVYFKGEIPEAAKTDVSRVFGDIPFKVERAKYSQQELSTAEQQAWVVISRLVKAKKINSATESVSADFSEVQVSINVVDKSEVADITSQIDNFNDNPIRVVATDSEFFAL